MTPETTTPASQGGPVSEKPCIHTLETGKHEWNCFHWVHQANAPFWYPQCPTCGWIDLDLMVKEAGLVKLPREDESRSTPQHEWVGDSMWESACRKCQVPHAAFRAGVADECLYLPAQTETCEWKQAESRIWWVAGCEGAAAFGRRPAQGWKFCPICGRTLREVPFNG